MKIIITTTILLLSLTLINAASLKNLSEKLSTSFSGIVDDKTKEKVPSDFHEDVDDVTSELDKLKAHNEDMKANPVASIDEQVENSLKQLQKSHHKSSLAHSDNEEKTPKSSKHSSEESFSSEQKQKEILENLPLPDANEVSTTTTSNSNSGHRLSMKNEQSSVISPATMLRQLNGKFSAYDIAQYIFWSGDEAGVASAIEELISENLMSRENAIEFLNDIRLGIDYLENTYSIKQNEGKNIRQQQPKTTTTTTQEPSVIDDVPFSYSYNYQKFHSFFKPTQKEKDTIEEDQTPTLSPIALQALKRIPSLIKLTEAHREGKQKQQQEISIDVDETGRERLADFLFGEYSLEEVIYQLAKTMFSQSLTSGSEESQAALQKLTQFLEQEGKHGRISPSLQKKILDVLLAALSDTLNENPEVMEKAARHALNAK